MDGGVADGRRGGLRSGRPRRIAAGEKSGQRHQRGRLFNRAETQLGPDRHARGKQRRRPAGDFRVSGPGLSFAGDEAAAAGPGGERSRPPPHEGAGAGRPAAETLSRCGVGTDPAAARVLRIGGKRGRLAADGNGRRGNDPARLRVGAAVEADLQFRSRQRRQLETGADRGRSRGGGRQRPQGDRFQPMGRRDRAIGGGTGAVWPLGVSRPDSPPPPRG